MIKGCTFLSDEFGVGGVNMLKDFVEKKHFNFVDKVESWQEAIRVGCQPLVADRTVDSTYAEQIIASVNKHGPYIVIIPGVAMPHVQENAAGVNKTSISFMKLKEAISFDESDPDKEAKLFFTLASCNHDEHLANMQMLMALLMNEELLAELMEVDSVEELLALHEKHL